MSADPLFDIAGDGGVTDQNVITVSGTDTPYTGTGVSSLRLVVNGKTQANPLQDAGGQWSGITALVPGVNTVAAVETVNGVVQTTRTVTYTSTWGQSVPVPPPVQAPAPASGPAPSPLPATPAPAPAPAVSITSAGGLTDVAATAVAGQATAFSAVTLFDNGSSVASTSAGADGHWSLAVTLGLGANDLSATDTTGAGTASSNTIRDTLDLTPPTVSVSPMPQFTGGTTAVLSGRASDAYSVSGVEIFSGADDLGAAAVAADGSWTFSHDFGQGTYGDLSAVAIDAAGNAAASAAPYALVTGIADHPYVDAAVQASPDGTVQSITTFTDDGSVGSQTVQGPNGRPVATGYQDGQWLFSLGHDVMTGNGADEHFVFTANMGHTEITDFRVGGAKHDTIALSSADGFDSVAEILAQTTMNHGSAVIHITADDSIRIDGVTKAQFAHHPGDFGILV